MNRTIRTLGELSCNIVETPGTKPEAVVVLCHGFGAPGSDLVPIATALAERLPAARGKVRFVFPEAPLSLGNMGFGDARAWWMIDMQALAARRMGDPATLRRMREEIPEGLDEARRLLRGAIDASLEEAGLGQGQLVLGGFSQGAMLTTELAIGAADALAPAALWTLSGALIAEERWRRGAQARAGLQVFQTHGTEDPILPFAGATALRDLLGEAGAEVEFLAFRGEHTIPQQAVDRMAASLGKLIGKP